MEEAPVLILGGGINGSAIARELLHRRIPVTLVDTADLGFGATSRSSRLIHGGLRYLEYGDFALVREALGERKRLLRSAPHLVRPLRFHIPVATRFTGLWSAVRRFLGWKVDAKKPRGRWLVQLGLRLYSWFASDPETRPVSTQTLGTPSAPPINAERYRWVCSYDDGQILYPERLVIEWMLDAREKATENDVDFHVYTRSRAMRDGREIEITGDADGLPRRIEPRLIINATGAWVDETLERLEVDTRRLMGGTKGSHLFIANDALAQALNDEAVYVEADDGRPIFILPMDEIVLVGTTDIRFDDSPESAIATDEEVEYLINAVRAVYPHVALTDEHVVAHYAGVRPLPYVDASSTAAITRGHTIHQHENVSPPMVSVIGGKLTTCRALAEEAADWVLEHFGDGGVAASTGNASTPGGRDYPAADDVEREIQRIADEVDWSPRVIAELWRLYGARTRNVVSRIDGYGPQAAEPLDDDCPLPMGVVRHACEEEWAATLSDVIERRLLLVYRKRLPREWLVRLAQAMHPDSPPQVIDETVRECAARLQGFYGRVLEGTN